MQMRCAVDALNANRQRRTTTTRRLQAEEDGGCWGGYHRGDRATKVIVERIAAKLHVRKIRGASSTKACTGKLATTCTRTRSGKLRLKVRTRVRCRRTQRHRCALCGKAACKFAVDKCMPKGTEVTLVVYASVANRAAFIIPFVLCTVECKGYCTVQQGCAHFAQTDNVPSYSIAARPPLSLRHPPRHDHHLLLPTC